MRARSLSIPLLLPLVLVLPLATGAPAAAQQIPPDPVLRDFEPIGEYILEVGGAELPGVRVFQSQKAGSAVLLLGPGLPGAVLVSPRAKAVQRVEPNKVVVAGDGVAFLLADAAPVRESDYAVAGREITFTLGGRPARLKERPYLLGLHPGGDLSRHDPGYAFRAQRYKPSPPVVQALRGAQPARVRVYFGSWCPHCSEVVPKIVKVAEALAGSPVKIEFYGLPMGFGNEPEAKRAGILSVPTGVVFRGGKEIGRIDGYGWSIPELAIKKVLDRQAQAGR